MIDIVKISKPQESKATTKKSSAGGANFASFLSQAQEVSTPSVSATSGVFIPNAIFATQTISQEEEEQRKKQTIKKGHNLIEKLETIRDSILLNDFSKDKLIEISRYVKKLGEQQASNDEELNEIVAQIELRVEVELAKLETAIGW